MWKNALSNLVSRDNLRNSDHSSHDQRQIEDAHYYITSYLTHPKDTVRCGLAALAGMLLGDEDLVDQHSKETSEVAVCNDAGEDVGQVGHW